MDKLVVKASIEPAYDELVKAWRIILVCFMNDDEIPKIFIDPRKYKTEAEARKHLRDRAAMLQASINSMIKNSWKEKYGDKAEEMQRLYAAAFSEKVEEWKFD